MFDAYKRSYHAGYTSFCVLDSHFVARRRIRADFVFSDLDNGEIVFYQKNSPKVCKYYAVTASQVHTPP